MNCVIPYTKEITFKTKIAEITSISLEHELNINEGEVLGNFIVSGEYKAHELSVNKESFEYTLPFSVDISSEIEKDSIKFNITDFTYELVKDDVLKVIIEFSLEGKEKEREEIAEEDIISEERNDLFEEAIKAGINDIEINEDEFNLENEKEQEELRGEDEEATEEEREISIISPDNEKTIIDSIKNEEDSYITYHVHLVKENETIESICTMYSTNANAIAEYNDISNITKGDKLLIPEEKNE